MLCNETLRWITAFVAFKVFLAKHQAKVNEM